ncbi:MAG: hypothetical protein KAJ66_06800 [Candidatus Omnitrophica bacterium]|nr:hypothetical protein [Candidatus Omnitrophota bacterium]
MENIGNLIYLIFGGVSGYFIKSWLEKRAERETRIFERKREKYQNLLRYLKGFMEGTANKKDKQLFLNELSESWLYASDSVVLKANKLLDEFIHSNEQGHPDDQNTAKNMLGELVLEMRRDLEYKNTKLKFSNYRILKIVD